MLQRLKTRILVIDDDPAVGVYLTRLLEETGRYSVEAEADSLIAMATARVFHPDLLFVDVFMPGRGGFELAEELRAEPRLRQCPIIFFTGKPIVGPPPGVIEGAAPMVYLAKGVSGDEIVELVARLLPVPQG